MSPVRVPCPDAPAWLIDALSVVEAGAPGGLVTGWCYLYPWFAGRVGPLVVPPVIDVVAPRAVDPSHLAAKLGAGRPGTRWRVKCATSAREAISREPLRACRGGLTLQEGAAVCILHGPEVLADLRDGVLLPSGPATPEAVGAAERLLALYPGLRAPFIDYPGKPVDSEYERIHRQVLEGENGGRRRQITLTGSEEAAAGAITAWHTAAQREIQPVALPPPSAMPEGDPWTAPDAEFREWLLRQTLLRSSGASDDPFLKRALLAQRGEQKPTHQGWETYQHAVVATSLIRTDGHPEDRRALRVAMLLHDLGKVHNVWTPGAHPLIGAKVWRKYRPEWLTGAEADLVTFLIRTHDLLGRLDRTLHYADFRAAVSPEEARRELALSGKPLAEALALHTSIYEADIGSLPALRWLLPLTPFLQTLVLSGAPEALVA